MVNFKRFLLLAPALCTIRSKFVLVSAIATVVFPPTVNCAGFPFGSSNGSGKDDKNRKKADGDDDIIKQLLEKLPPELKNNVEGIVDSGVVKVKNLFESGLPAQVGYGFMMGYSSGFVLKKVSKLLAFGIGSLFIVIQTLSYNGFIKVDYDNIQKEVEKRLDVNNDGVFDGKDVEEGMKNVKKVLEYNMPSGGGFASGLLFGLRG